MNLMKTVTLTSARDAVPVLRSALSASQAGRVTASGALECSLCHLACNQIPDPLGQQACHIACQAAVC